MKKQSYLILLLSLFLMASCIKDDLAEISDVLLDDETTEEEADPTKIDQNLILGRGYDVFDNYADVKMVRGAILDYDKMSANGLLLKNNVENSIFKTVSGSSMDTYLEEVTKSVKVDVSLDAGKKFAFTGSVDVNFNSSQSGNSANSFATVKSIINKNQIKIKDEYGSEDLKGFLSKNFERDIENEDITPNELFDRYGTHCLRDIILGGRLDYNVSINNNYVANSSSLAIQAEASFKSSFLGIDASANSSANTSTRDSTTSNNEYMEKRLVVYGGLSEYGQNIINNDDYDMWIQSINDHSVFCDFGNKPFIPIWELCNDPGRSQQIKDAFIIWRDKCQFTPNTDTATVEYNFEITDWKLVNGDAIFQPWKYEIMDIDFSLELEPSNEGNILLHIRYHLKEGATGICDNEPAIMSGTTPSELDELKTIKIQVPESIGYVIGIRGDLKKEYSTQFWCPPYDLSEFESEDPTYSSARLIILRSYLEIQNYRDNEIEAIIAAIKEQTENEENESDDFPIPYTLNQFFKHSDPQNVTWGENAYFSWFYYISDSIASDTEISDKGFVKAQDGFIDELLFKVDDNLYFDWGQLGLKGKLEIPVVILKNSEDDAVDSSSSDEPVTTDTNDNNKNKG